MKRAYVAAVAALAATLSLGACAREPAPAVAQTAPAPMPPAQVEQQPASAAPRGDYLAGKHYQTFRTPTPTDVAPGKVEVIEFFWYGCGHCYALDPTLENWKATKAPYIEFRRVHVMWGPLHQQHAKIYYTLQALRRPDLHPLVFEEIHRYRNLLAAREPAEARALVQAFFQKNGVSRKDFDAAYDSMSVATQLKRGEELATRYAIESVPAIAINGRYLTDVTMAGGPADLIELINQLAAKEHDQ